MRHSKHRGKLNRTGSHRRCMIANMVKSLVEHGRVETTVTKAKEVRRYAEAAVTLAKRDTLAAKRQLIADLMVRFNRLTPKESRAAQQGNTQAYNDDRRTLQKLSDLKDRFAERQGGYTRIVRMGARKGDGAEQVLLEWV